MGELHLLERVTVLAVNLDPTIKILGIRCGYICIIQPDPSFSVHTRSIVNFIRRIESRFERIASKKSKSRILINHNVIAKRGS